MRKLILVLVSLLFLQFSDAQDKVAIYWDASFSMQDRNLVKELNFLDNYFKKNTETTVDLIVFSNDILFEQTYTISNSEWSDLRTELQQTIYDGATSYKPLFKSSANVYMLFTDGLSNIDQLDPPKDKQLYIISTANEVKTAKLKYLAKRTGGRFFYLNPYNIRETGVKSKVETEQDKVVNTGLVTGVVLAAEGPLANVSIINQTTNKGVASDIDGNFEIKADKGDILIFSFLGKKTVSIRIEKATSYKITMANIDENLEEVVLTAQVEEQEETVNTGNVRIDKKRLGYDVEEITKDDISYLDTDLTKAVVGQFSNLEIRRDENNRLDLGKFLGRGRNMTILLNQYGLIVVDGVPLGQSESNFGGIAYPQDNIINPDMIESITYLKGLAATNKYGTLGRNGVVLITTKNAMLDEAIEGNTSTELAGTTDYYSGSAETIAELPNNEYIAQLKTATSVNQAFQFYIEQREKFGDNPSFYFDVSDYFKGWNNKLIQNRILSNVLEIAFNNTTYLKALAYKQQELGLFNEALVTTQRINDIANDQSQSYRDLALGHTLAKNYQDALDIYNNIDKQTNVGNTNFFGLRKSIINEAKNLVALHKAQLNTVGVSQNYLRNNKYKSRIVFEWNNANAQFDLNIINPQNRFFTWSHTNTENSQRILQEKQQGYGLEEYYLTEDDKGEWKFNVKYYGNGTEEPTFIKITTYKNFGFPNQSMTINVIRLDKTNVEQTVSELTIN